jgi:VanZ family protein
MYHKYRLLIHAAITALIMAFIYYQSSLPATLSSEMSGHLERIVAWILGKPSESVTFAVRKAAHVTEFTALGISLFYTVRDFLEWRSGTTNNAVPQNRQTTQMIQTEKLRRIVLPWVIGTIYAVSDEVHQLFVDGRAGRVLDVLIDFAGSSLGIIISYIFKNK